MTHLFIKQVLCNDVARCDVSEHPDPRLSGLTWGSVVGQLCKEDLLANVLCCNTGVCVQLTVMTACASDELTPRQSRSSCTMLGANHLTSKNNLESGYVNGISEMLDFTFAIAVLWWPLIAKRSALVGSAWKRLPVCKISTLKLHVHLLCLFKEHVQRHCQSYMLGVKKSNQETCNFKPLCQHTLSDMKQSVCSSACKRCCTCEVDKSAVE